MTEYFIRFLFFLLATMGPPVTVTIATYERPQLLRQALQSVAMQEYDGNIDAVVVDNSETKTAESVVEEFDCATYHWQQTHVPRQETGMENLAVSRDLGFHFVDGEYIHLLDDDDKLRPMAIARKIDAIQRHPQAAAAYNAIEKHDGEVKHVPDVVVGNELAFALTNLRPPTLPSALLVRRDVLLDCPPRRSLPHEDISGLIEILLRTPLVYVDEPLTVRTGPPDGGQSIDSQRGRLRTHERYSGLRNCLLSEPLQRHAKNSYETIIKQLETAERA